VGGDNSITGGDGADRSTDRGEREGPTENPIRGENGCFLEKTSAGRRTLKIIPGEEQGSSAEVKRRILKG